MRKISNRAVPGEQMDSSADLGGQFKKAFTQARNTRRLKATAKKLDSVSGHGQGSVQRLIGGKAVGCRTRKNANLEGWQKLAGVSTKETPG